MGLSLVRTLQQRGPWRCDGSSLWRGPCGLVAFPPERYGCERCGALADDHER